jgi:hypothetical protein
MDVRCCPKADKRADVLGRPLCAKSDLTRRSYTSNPPVASPAKTDLLLRNVNTGGLEVYDINNNQLTNACRATVHTPRGRWLAGIKAHDRENGRQIRPACGWRRLHYFLRA